MQSKIIKKVVLYSLFLLLTGCGGSSGGSDSSSNGAGSVTSNTDSNSSDNASLDNSAPADLLGEIPSGGITSYGAVTVGDDVGIASDLVAAFFQLSDGLSRDFLSTVFSSDRTLCTVDDDDRLDFEEISAGFIPSFNGIDKQAVSAGDTITLSSSEGTYATLEKQAVGAFLFYTLPSLQMLPDGAVPNSLQADIPGDVFPGYQLAILPEVEPLQSIEFTGGDSIDPSSTFTWAPSSNPEAMIRIFSSTQGGFFLEDGKTVTCLTPDTGSFVFPASVQAELGSDFRGGTPIFSRVTVQTRSTENSILFLIRESFVD